MAVTTVVKAKGQQSGVDEASLLKQIAIQVEQLFDNDGGNQDFEIEITVRRPGEVKPKPAAKPEPRRSRKVAFGGP